MSTAEPSVFDLLEKRTIPVIVKPGASETRILGTRQGALHIAIAAPPEGGKANELLLKLLAKQTGKVCTLVSGETSRKKLVKCELPKRVARD